MCAYAYVCAVVVVTTVGRVDLLPIEHLCASIKPIVLQNLVYIRERSVKLGGACVEKLARVSRHGQADHCVHPCIAQHVDVLHTMDRWRTRAIVVE